jgi:hypothetical protein
MVTTMKDIILEWDNRLKKRQQDRKEWSCHVRTVK